MEDSVTCRFEWLPIATATLSAAYLIALSFTVKSVVRKKSDADFLPDLRFKLLVGVYHVVWGCTS